MLAPASARPRGPKRHIFICYSSHESVASFIVEKRRAEVTKRLWTAEMTMEDIEALDENHEGGGKCCITSHGPKVISVTLSNILFLSV